VEGQTERAVIQKVLAPYMAARGLYLHPRIIGKPGHKGGIRRFHAVLREIVLLLKQEPQSLVSTFFDYYALPGDWPGSAEAKSRNNAVEAPLIIEEALANEVTRTIGDAANPNRFIPYIQMHELEALLFVNPEIMASSFERPELAEKFAGIVKECGGCENIDDNPATAPSKRIENLFPAYKKGSSVNAHAPLIMEQTGIDSIRQHCPHFNQWLETLLG